MRKGIGKIVGVVLSTGVMALSGIALANAAPYIGSDIEVNGNTYQSITGSSWFNSEYGHITLYNSDPLVTYRAYLTSDSSWFVGLNVLAEQGDPLGSPSLPASYTHVDIYNSNQGTTYSTAASTTEINSIGFVFQPTSDGYYDFSYRWTNDLYNAANHVDANLQIKTAFFDKRSTPVAAEPVSASLFVLGSAILSVTGVRKRRSA